MPPRTATLLYSNFLPTFASLASTLAPTSEIKINFLPYTSSPMVKLRRTFLYILKRLYSFVGINGSTLLNNGTKYTKYTKGSPDDSGWIRIPCVSTDPFLIPTISKVNQLKTRSVRWTYYVNVLQLKSAILFKDIFGYGQGRWVPWVRRGTRISNQRHFLCVLQQRVHLWTRGWDPKRHNCHSLQKGSTGPW